jgi:hypothetical protein
VQIQPTPGIPPRRWTLAAHLDATKKDLDPSTTREAVVFQNNPQPELAAILELRRKPPSKATAILKMAALPAAMAAAAVACYLAPGWLSGSLGLDAISLGALSFFKGRKELTLTQEAPKYHQESNWSGSRTLDVSAGKPSADMKLNSPVLEKTSWAGTLQRYPSQYSAVLVSGHAHAYKGVAGLKPAEIQAGLREAHQSSGKKVDLLILEACEGANLETLKEFGQHAKYALVSQDQMWAAGLPWSYVLPKLDELAQTPESMGTNLVKLTGGLEGKVPTLALIDLEKLPAVTEGVEKLAGKLAESLDGPQREGILKAFSEAERFPGPPKAAEGLLGRLSEIFRRVKERVMPPDLGDLGGFLQGLSQHCSDPQILELAQQTQKALSEAVVSNQVSQAQQGKANGLTMRMPTGLFFQKEYTAQTGMQNWGKLLHELQPWQTRLSNNLAEPTYTAARHLLPVLPSNLGI